MHHDHIETFLIIAIAATVFMVVAGYFISKHFKLVFSAVTLLLLIFAPINGIAGGAIGGTVCFGVYLFGSPPSR